VIWFVRAWGGSLDGKGKEDGDAMRQGATSRAQGGHVGVRLTSLLQEWRAARPRLRSRQRDRPGSCSSANALQREFPAAVKLSNAQQPMSLPMNLANYMQPRSNTKGGGGSSSASSSISSGFGSSGSISRFVGGGAWW
jgi:hypothetical protein